MMITLTGCLQSITFHNDDNHYTIGRFKSDSADSLITVVGYMPDAGTGRQLKITGGWESHPRYGQQFKIEAFEIVLPGTVDGIEKYLGSGIIKGVGPKMAARLVRRFAERTLEIIEKEPRRLQEVEGIGRAKVSMISEAWKNHHSLRLLMHFLQEHGVNVSFSAVLLKCYGADALEMIRDNPYCITEDISIAEFPVADTIARSLGVPGDAPERIHSCLLFFMEKAAGEGHVFQYEDRLVNHCARQLRVDEALIRNALDALADKGSVVQTDVPFESELQGFRPAVYLKELYRAETGVARKLNAMLTVPVEVSTISREQMTQEVLKKVAVKLSDEQLMALEEILRHRVVIITGGPGTGKTTLIRSISAIFEFLGRQTLLAAPTGRAARRLSEVVHRKAATLHKLLGYNAVDGCFEKNQDNPLETDTVIVDEASMVDALLMYNLLKAVPLASILILVGDIFQLPSVGPGNILKDMIRSKRIKTIELKKIFRQAQESPIVVNAHKIRRGELPDLNPADDKEKLSEFYFIQQHDPAKVVKMVTELCSERIPKRFEYVNEIQVLTPMHKGDVGTINLNQVLQDALNPSAEKMRTSRGGVFKTGDKVMHLKNNYQKEVFNGDIGIVKDIDPRNKQLTVNYEGRDVVYEDSELKELSLAYAISVHKSQGSEYDAVVVPLMTQHFPMLQRNLLYTAMTRGKELVILVGTLRALNIALNNDKPRRRLSSLSFRLAGNDSSADKKPDRGGR